MYLVCGIEYETILCKLIQYAALISAAHHMYVWDLAWVLSVLVGWQIIVVMASTYRFVLWRSVLFGYWWELCSWVFIKQAVLTNVT